ncbi:LOW QUALITY PROTEIN: optineurin-like [Chlamydotis macqueenii]
MSSKLKSHPAENGEHPKRKTENGTDSMAASALSTYTPEEMVQQMKELITESNGLKEAMKLHNQAMKDRYEELSICREKQKEERGFYELKFKEVKQCLLDKCMENEKLQQHLQNLKERGGAEMEGCMAPEKEMRQLISQVHRLQAEKANMLGIISDLQVKLNISAEDSFVEIGMKEIEINRAAKEHQENSGELTSNIDIYGRSKTADEKNLQSEELIVSQLLYCLRNETQKREELEKELQNHKERLSKLEKKTSNCLKSGTQTEEQAEESSEAVGSEVETLSLEACALFKELQEAHEKVKEAELIQKQLQEKCQVLERKSSAAASELEEKQQLIYTIKKLELQVESMQAEVKLEQAKAHEEKGRYSSLQDTNSKLLPELTKAMKTIDEMKLKELHRVDKVVVEQLNAKVELAEQVPALEYSGLQILYITGSNIPRVNLKSPLVLSDEDSRWDPLCSTAGPAERGTSLARPELSSEEFPPLPNHCRSRQGPSSADQGPKETPSEFLDKLRDTMRRHTPLDPGSEIGIQQLVSLFIGQLARRDLLEQLKAEIKFEKGKVELQVGNDQLIELLSLALIDIDSPVNSGIPEEIQNQVYPGALLVEQDDVEIVVTNVVNPAAFLSGTTGEPVSHDCLETIEAVYSSRPDLKDEPLEDAEDSWYTDGSSFVRQGVRKAGYVVTTMDQVVFLLNFNHRHAQVDILRQK